METIKIKGIDEEIYYTTTKEGLPIYIWKNEYAKSFYLSLNVHYGSIHTEFLINNKKHTVPNGIAHFMEHIKFNVKKGVTANDLFDPLGSDINAFTTFKYTSYLVYGTSRLQENLNALLDYVYNPYFTKGMIKKEKGIIASEINMGKDQPYNRLFFEFNKCIYESEKYRNLITGEVEDIEKIKLEDILLIYDTFYHPKNMFLIVTGNVNPYEIEEIVSKNLKKKEFVEFKNPTLIKIKESKHVNKKLLELKANVEVSKAKIGLKLNKKDFLEYDDIHLNILFSILLDSNFGDTSLLKEELLAEGLITYLSSNRYVMDDYIIIDITIESKYLEEAIKKIVNALEHLEMNEEDLIRKVHSSIATLVTNYETSEQVNNMIQNYIIYYNDIVTDLKEIYESITLKDIQSIIEKINTKEMTIVKMEKND